MSYKKTNAFSTNGSTETIVKIEKSKIKSFISNIFNGFQMKPK